MRKHRFPRMAYVRQLQRLYDEIGDWRKHYGRDATDSWWDDASWRLVARLEQLESIQHELRNAITHLRGLEDLS